MFNTVRENTSPTNLLMDLDICFDSFITYMSYLYALMGENFDTHPFTGDISSGVRCTVHPPPRLFFANFVVI